MKVKAKKQFGQNFISDPNLINRIVDLLGSDKDSLVIEIGPGTGALTKTLVQKFSKVVAIEIDNDLADYLHTEITAENFELLNADILSLDFSSLIRNYQQSYQKVYLISNLPYYITSQILFKTLEISGQLTKAVFMMQKEVAQRICAQKNENNYNNLSVAAQFYAERKYEFTVSKNKFQPMPKVDSAIISLTFNDQNLKKVPNHQEFIKFVRDLFNNRRKTILNNLGTLINNKQQALVVLNEAKIEPMLRPENIGLDEFLDLFVLFKRTT